MKISRAFPFPESKSGEQRAAKLRKASLDALREREKQTRKSNEKSRKLRLLRLAQKGEGSLTE